MIAAILIFLIPTFVFIISKITDKEEIYTCFWNIKKEAIVEAEKRESEIKKQNQENYNNQNNQSNNQNNQSSNQSKKLSQTGEFKKQIKTSKGRVINYWVLVPENATENMPLIMYMHGGGGNKRYNDIKDIEMAKEVKRIYGNNYPFIVVLPVKSTSSWYEMGGGFKIFYELINEVTNEYKANKNKVILTGCSDGALGTWQFGVDYPNLFSALVPVSGWGHLYAEQKIDALKDKPIRGIVSSANYDAYFKQKMQEACTRLNSISSKQNCTLEVKQGLTHDTIINGTTVNGVTIEGAYTKEVFEWMINQ